MDTTYLGILSKVVVTMVDKLHKELKSHSIIPVKIPDSPSMKRASGMTSSRKFCDRSLFADECYDGIGLTRT
jgi:hypothetical protein